MTVAHHIAQLRQLVLEHPEASNLPLVVHGIGASFEVHVRNHVVTIGHAQAATPEVADGATA